MAKSAPKKEETSGDAKPKKGKGKLMIIIGVALVLLLGGGAAFVLLAKKNAGGGHEEAKAQPQKAPVFVNLEPFTVNLQPENGEQFLQVVATLKLSEKEVEDNIKVYMPELRHKILLLLSGKRASEISSPEGRETLSDDMRRQVNAILYAASGRKPAPLTAAKPIGKVAASVPPTTRPSAPDDPIQGVLFTSFIVQ